MRASILVLFWLFLSSCRHVDLLDARPEKAGMDAGVSWHKDLQKNRPHCAGVLDIRGTDTWSSRVLRWFTPLSENHSPFQLQEAGANSAVNLPGQSPFVLKDSELSGWDRIYVESLRLYVTLPQAIAAAYNPVYLGEKTLGTETFAAFFFTLKPGDWNDPSLDQYIAYYPKGSPKLTLVQFTYRDLSRSYVGWLRYGPDKAFAAFPYPSSVSILDDSDAHEAVHTVEINSMTCLP
ncbi:MAG TPA: hypothetical protein VFO10_30995 [Oligoflexus sp.]|uniref:hypothetical protein n=1 Tax=Oligoflexus sp. TaxID=1971216 RepID=UPI002D7FB415|nr:hypothetical protein [Oligoflexus sp.]HET9241736.1 hypothetical protein [Oligoflexus sp.]